MKKALFAVLGLALGATTLLAIGSQALAYRGDLSVQNPNYSQDRHNQMTAVIENKDYEAWLELMQGKGRVTEVVNSDNFDRFAEMHRLMQEGRIDEANAIREELGLGLAFRDGTHKGQSRGFGRNAKR